MVDGLETLLDSNYSFTFYRMDGRIADEVKGDELICVKAEKISGAVDFINNICKLPVQVNPDLYIQKLESVFSKFTSYAKSKINELETNISSLESQIDELSKTSLVSIYDRLFRRNYYNKGWYQNNNQRKMFRYLLEIRNRLGIDKSLVRPALRELKVLQNKRNELQTKLNLSNYILSVLTDAVKKIVGR